ncbi:MAG: ComF family protein [Spirochaetaceae bacterium]|nr:MAG: ComF family protein [Spirochaetaceae bacterium]
MLLSEREVCLDCRERTHRFTLHRSAFAYDERTAELLRAFKAEGTRSLGQLFGLALLQLYRQHCTGALLVPVPGHPAATRRRGWDQAHELCLSMSRLAGVEVNRALRRGRSRRQKELTFAERQTNLRGRIRVAANPHTLGCRSVALVDDVYTTGATLDACCEALQAAGVAEVFAFTVAMDL